MHHRIWWGLNCAEFDLVAECLEARVFFPVHSAGIGSVVSSEGNESCAKQEVRRDRTCSL